MGLFRRNSSNHLLTAKGIYRLQGLLFERSTTRDVSAIGTS